jgi:hypothetical protein
MITIAETEKVRREAMAGGARLKQASAVGGSIHLTVQLVNGRREQFVQSHLFSRQVVYGMTKDRQAIFLLNPAHVDQFVVASAPPRSIAGVWPMARFASL